MIRPWVRVLASFHRAPIWSRMWLIVLAVTGYAAGVWLVKSHFFSQTQTVNAGMHGFLGLVLGMLLVFRTNTSYDRWWEARKQWGQLVNDSRNLAIKVQTCVRADSADKVALGRLLVGFAFSLRGHLRGGVRLQEVPGCESLTDQPPHVPSYLASQIYSQLERWRQSEQLGGFELLFLDRHAAGLMDVCGACERIQKSPISASYRWFIRQMIVIYLLTLPWGLVADFGYWSILAVALLSYFMVGVEMIAEEIEDPFDGSEDDIELDAICQTIESSVMTLLEGGLGLRA